MVFARPIREAKPRCIWPGFFLSPGLVIVLLFTVICSFRTDERTFTDFINVKEENVAPVIRIKNVGKRYSDLPSGSPGNNTLRDAISSGVRSFGSRVLPSNRNIALDTKREEFWALQRVSVGRKTGQALGSSVGTVPGNPHY